METITNTATAKQIAFIRRLVEEKDLTGTSFGVSVDEGLLDDMLAVADKRTASSFIESLLALPRKAAAAPVKAEVPEGMHRDGGVIFKVQRAVHGSGNLYAKRLISAEKCYCSDLQGVLCGVCRDPKASNWSFEYAPGMMRYLSEETAMTLEEAKKFGSLYGTCCVCARTLTNEESIAAGIGPVCASKF